MGEGVVVKHNRILYIYDNRRLTCAEWKLLYLVSGAHQSAVAPQIVRRADPYHFLLLDSWLGGQLQLYREGLGSTQFNDLVLNLL